MEIRQVVASLFLEVVASSGCQPCGAPEDGLELLQSGLDSLGFAILVVRLEETLGYDPFVLSDKPVYPRTFGEFVAEYERFASHAKA